MRMPLEDVRVLDLSHALAGPFCSTMLADFGAEVIKLEPRGAGDISRAWGTRLPGGETSYFVSLHRNKKGIEVDLKHAEGKELFFRLMERCDVVLENYRTGALERLGLGYEAARKRNAGIIYCSVSGFGQDGPYRDRAALDLILQAESGMISVTGEPGSHGVRCGTSIADMTAGMYAAYGIMLALRVKERTGRGQSIDVSMLEGQLSLLGSMIGGYLADGETPAPMGTAYKALLPYQTFRTRTPISPSRWGARSCGRSSARHRPPGADRRSALSTNGDHARHRDSLIAELQETFLTRPYEEWEPILLAKGIPFGAINGVPEVVEHPQVKARGALVEMDHPQAGKVAHGRCARAPLGDAGCGADALAPPSPAHGGSPARPPRARRGRGGEAARRGRHSADLPPPGAMPDAAGCAGAIVIELREVEQAVGGAVALDDVSIEVPPGTAHVLLGSSGSGKSTILRLVLGLTAPDAGAVVVGGTPVDASTRAALVRQVGYVVQDGGLYPHLTAADNAALGAEARGWPGPRIAARLAELAAMADLDRGLRGATRELSGGQRQRVA